MASILETMDIFLEIVTNPDGFAYTQTTVPPWFPPPASHSRAGSSSGPFHSPERAKPPPPRSHGMGRGAPGALRWLCLSRTACGARPGPSTRILSASEWIPTATGTQVLEVRAAPLPLWSVSTKLFVVGFAVCGRAEGLGSIRALMSLCDKLKSLKSLGGAPGGFLDHCQGTEGWKNLKFPLCCHRALVHRGWSQLILLLGDVPRPLPQLGARGEIHRGLRQEPRQHQGLCVHPQLLPAPALPLWLHLHCSARPEGTGKTPVV